jgi:putative acetyltransferase
MALTLELTQSPTDDARMLIEEMEAQLGADYRAEQRHGYSVDRIFQPNVLFFIARLDGEAVGCGGIAFEDGFAELKRMYVRPHKREQGIGRAILARLEEAAGARGVDRMVLETGDVLHPAIRLYEQAGFTRCEAFGSYVAMPPPSIQRSVFMEKWLGKSAPTVAPDRRGNMTANLSGGIIP